MKHEMYLDNVEIIFHKLVPNFKSFWSKNGLKNMENDMSGLNFQKWPLAYNVAIAKEHMAKTGYKVGGALPYSPNLAPMDFLFSRTKNNIASIPNDGETAKTRWGLAISTITTDNFTKAYNKWILRWNKATEKRCDYVKKKPLLNKFL